MMPGWMMTGWGAGYGLFGGLMMLLFWILIIAGIVLIVRWFFGQEDPQGSLAEETALDILRKRYACGEIDKEEFKAKRKDILT